MSAQRPLPDSPALRPPLARPHVFPHPPASAFLRPMPAPRIACLRIPRFAIGAVVRARRPGIDRQLSLDLPLVGDPGRTAPPPTPTPASEEHDHWDQRLLALTDGPRLRVVSAAAGAARLRAGMTTTEARARCARLELLPWDPVAIGAAITRVTGALVKAAPQVTPAGGAPGTWWIGAAGFDGLGGDLPLARRLLAIARRWHPGARVAIADSGVAARAATWAHHASDAATSHDDRAITLISPGRDADYLAPLPLAFLPLDDEFAAALTGLGYHSVGALAALPEGDVEQRWGAIGRAAWHLAHGHDPRRPVLARLDDARSVTTELGGRSETLEPVLFLLRAALDRLVRDAARDGRAVGALTIALHLDTTPAALATREVRPAQPLGRVAPLFERCRAALEGWTLDAPVTGLTVTLTETPPATGDQGDLLDDGWRDPGAALAALERLRAALGPGTVVRPVLRDDHRPDAGGAWAELVDGDERDDPDALALAVAPPPSPDAAALPALRLLDAPATLRIACDADARPVAAAWDDRPLTIEHATGPERLSGAWWRHPWARDYWRLRTRERGTLLVYHDHPATPRRVAESRPAPAGTWFVQGWYD